MRKVSAEPYRDIDFAGARRGALRAPTPGKTKISIRLDVGVLEHFRRVAEAAGGGNYQTMINDALVAHIQHDSFVILLRRLLQEELAKAHRGQSAKGEATRGLPGRINAVRISAGKGAATPSKRSPRLKAIPGAPRPR